MKNISIPVGTRIARLLSVFSAMLFATQAALSAPIAQNADFSYILTTQNDPAKPGELVPFAITVTNLTGSAKSTQLSIVMPDHLFTGSYSPGEVYNFGNTSIEGGKSKTVRITPTIYSGASSPADGTMIELTVRDVSRATMVSRIIEVQSAREEELKLSTSTGSVAPGGEFTYTLAYHNARPGPIVGAKLSLQIPAGASFVSADGGGTVSGGAVRWSLGTLASAQTGQVQVRFTAPSLSSVALLLDAALLDSADQVVAQASDAKVIESTPVFSYSLTTQGDPARPGEKVPFAITVTNLTSATQTISLTFDMPNFAYSGSYSGGETVSFGQYSVAAGASQTFPLAPTITSGATSPPDGAIINAVVRDVARGAAVSRSIVVQSAPVADLKLSTDGGTVAPGENFTYTLGYHNWSPATVVGAKISLPVPAGATFVSADSGGTLTNGVVNWSLGNLSSALTGQVRVTFTAPAVLSSHMLLDARLRNSADQVLAQASDAKTMASSPVFSYSLTTQANPAGPGEKVPFVITVTNLTNAVQTTILTFDMPNFAYSGSYSGGETVSFGQYSVAAGASQTFTLAPTINSGTDAPPDGAILNAIVRDLARGISLSRSIVVQSVPIADLKISSNGGTVAPGTPFTCTLAYHNWNTSAIPGAVLNLEVPAGTTFVSADGGGTLANGSVQWTLGNLASSKTGHVQVTFIAPPTQSSHLLLNANLRNGSGAVLAQASNFKTMASFPVFSYALTTQTDTVLPGEILPYTITVTNLTNSTQSTILSFEVPNDSSDGSYTGGETYSFGSFSVTTGASRSFQGSIRVGSGVNGPPDGTILNLIARDVGRGVTFSRSVIVQSTPAADLKLSTPEATVISGGEFSYTLTYRNRSAGTIAGTKLTLPVPAGATFVSADGGGNLVDGVVQWAVGATPAGFASKVRVNFVAPTTGKAALLIDARLQNGANEVLAQASDVKTIYDFPTFSYELIPQVDQASPGSSVSYILQLTNLTNSTQTSQMTVRIPRHTRSGSYEPGELYYLYSGSVASKASTGISIVIPVDGGVTPAPDGSIINLVVTDVARGASVSHTLAVNRMVYTYGTIIRIISLGGNLDFGNVPVGQSQTRTLTIGNSGTSPLTVSKITYPVGFSGSYSGVIPVGESRNVSVTFRPTAGKTYSGNLSVTSDKTAGGNLRPLSGLGLSRAIKLTGKLNFGKVKVGSKKTLALTISNPGNSPLTVTGIKLPKGYSASFAGVIPSGTQKKISVSFRPTSKKKYNGKVSVTSNKMKGVATLGISGKGK